MWALFSSSSLHLLIYQIRSLDRINQGRVILPHSFSPILKICTHSQESPGNPQRFKLCSTIYNLNRLL